MTYETKKMLEDSNGDLIPQYWDVVDQEFKPLTGKDGAQDTRLTGSNVEIASIEYVEVTAGTTKRIFEPPNIDVSNFVYLYVRVVAENGHIFEVYQDIRQFTLKELKNQADSSVATSLMWSDPYRPFGTVTNIRIKNTEIDDQAYRVELYGLRG